eukprot:CAMPEP_0202708456 /NCGR_PEP_ID=MMETSP1385-20130828/20662_1 /ASSEMBLY_ACC=CAM_ASM_000861 /TAXON_ID=933848 /ORGANISM="Elphidium margaritaceum" /LENGTH=649 /DNA_ID=CAMNT_0049367431 /DNA_START=14 /DNA_END=1963 /DNA_ORIENTATION=+
MTTPDTQKFDDMNFSLNAKGYIVFNEQLVIDERYKLEKEIVLDDQGNTAKGRYGSVFRVKDLTNGKIRALKINRIPPEEEHAKRQAAKEELKSQQTGDSHPHHPPTTLAATANKNTTSKDSLQPNGGDAQQTNAMNNGHQHRRHMNGRKVKSVKERYESSCKREIGVLKRITRKNQNELIPCLVLYDYGEYLGHTYMVFPIYDLPLQQHLDNVQQCQSELKKTSVTSNSNHDNGTSSGGGVLNNPPNAAPNNALIHPDDLWAFQEQLISALAYIHVVCNVMHLDFKPKNVMINHYGYDTIKYAKNLSLLKLRQNHITLIDFSVSAKAPKKANLDEVKFTGNFGTRRYRPPEMIYGGKWNRSVDTYGAAMIVLECVKAAPVIDGGYYKKKKLLRYKKKLKALQTHHANDAHVTVKARLHSSYKQLQIADVLYLIVQQNGFPTQEYWTSLTRTERLLFPSLASMENILRKGKKSKLFEAEEDAKANRLFVERHLTTTQENNAVSVSTLDSAENKAADKDNNHHNAGDNLMMMLHERGHEQEADAMSMDSAMEHADDDKEDEDRLAWKYLNEKLKTHEGVAWSLFNQYGEALIEQCRLRLLEQCLKQMVVWNPCERITPERILKTYFPQNSTYHNVEPFTLDVNHEHEHENL